MSELDLAFGLLDHQIVDAEGRRCGKVDELEIEGGPGETPQVRAILVGSGAWTDRGLVSPQNWPAARSCASPGR
jgi:hypothetical protein